MSDQPAAGCLNNVLLQRYAFGRTTFVTGLMKRMLVLGLAYWVAAAAPQRTQSQTPPTYGTPVPTMAAETYGPFVKGIASLFGGPNVSAPPILLLHLQPGPTQ